MSVAGLCLHRLPALGLKDERRKAMAFVSLCILISLGSIKDWNASAEVVNVCDSCHQNATCEDKSDGSGGKVCNCMYGFVGNGRTYCQDKDECQLGKICGEHTLCHNTFGSYYCTCVSGFRPSNRMSTFIPNDGTFCHDVDECVVQGVCGDGGVCLNTEGDFSCSCQTGFNVQNGSEPFHPHRHTTSCKKTVCGEPVALAQAVREWDGGVRVNSTVTYRCLNGFQPKHGRNLSVCGHNGYWTPPTLVCQVIDCGSPPSVPHAALLSRPDTHYGSRLVYGCGRGFRWSGGEEHSVCGSDGLWHGPTLICEETVCGEPVALAQAVREWDGGVRVNSTVTYRCLNGFQPKHGRNLSVCGHNGYWTPPTLVCQEVDCGVPPSVPHSVMMWRGPSAPGSVVRYVCDAGYRAVGGVGVAVCDARGRWSESGVRCEAVCGPAPQLPHAETVWVNSTMVTYRCVKGFHGRGGGGATSTCDDSGHWNTPTLSCTERKRNISDLMLSKQRCLSWRTESEGERETYTVRLVGERVFERVFSDRRRQMLTSSSRRPLLCLHLLPVTNYSITVTAESSPASATLHASTGLPVPPAPDVLYQQVESSSPTLTLQRSSSSLDAICVYQVLVLPLEDVLLFDCSWLDAPGFFSRRVGGGYVAAELRLWGLEARLDFTLGDGRSYGGFFNAPLQSARDYCVILRTLCRWGSDRTQSCVIWAKASGTSFILKVSALTTVGVISSIGAAVVLGYWYSWYYRKSSHRSFSPPL